MTSAGDTTARTNNLIWRTVMQVPHGRVTTYGQIADIAGLGKAARRVGRALRELPSGSEVPWHRVLRAGGILAFPRHSDGYQRQVDRLAAEGIELLRGRVDMTRFGWQRTLDEWMWNPDA